MAYTYIVGFDEKLTINNFEEKTKNRFIQNDGGESFSFNEFKKFLSLRDILLNNYEPIKKGIENYYNKTINQIFENLGDCQYITKNHLPQIKNEIKNIVWDNEEEKLRESFYSIFENLEKNKINLTFTDSLRYLKNITYQEIEKYQMTFFIDFEIENKKVQEKEKNKTLKVK